MNEIIEFLKTTISDEVLSKDEKRTLKSLVGKQPLDLHQLNVLRSTIYELASEKVNANNYSFIVEWIKSANSALIIPPSETTDAFFSPGDACRNVIIRQIEMASNQLQVCVFTISDDNITKSLILAHKKGVHIQLITDNDKSLDIGSDIDQLARAGIAVKMDTSPNHMHHKFMLADQRALITGSYNWTLSAAKYNHENILLTHEPGVIKSFAHHFDLLWDAMEKYQ